jgi:NAD(P)H-dependent flavin oxidoreductase YrpB (nitropropane dioxygenase family)
VKEKFLAATSSSTVRSRSTTGKPARQLRTAWTEAWDDPNSPDPLPMPLQFSLIDEAHQRIQRSASARPGAAELITYFVGQVVGSLNDVKSARQVVFEMIEEYIEVAEQMGSSLHEN